jgi:quercetin dioxygenase-like cupin family protein
MAELPNFVNWEAITPRTIAPGVTIRVFSSAQLMLSMVLMDPGAVIPPHQHRHEQMGIWLEGDATAVIGGQERPVRPGDCYYIPGNVEHSFRVGPAGARALDIFQPPREDYLS